jgi:transcriptional repressor NrdR
MRCPYCGFEEDRVVDSRSGKEGTTIRRRRECLECRRRYTTYEQIEEMFPIVVKKDGRREAFDRMKIKNGITKACEKRPISSEAVEEAVLAVENCLLGHGEREVPSTLIGEKVMEVLHDLDGVAYVRFASVYRQFKDITEFMSELKDLLDKRGARGT